MKCMHLEETEVTSELNEDGPSILVKNRGTCQINETKKPSNLGKFREGGNGISPWCTGNVIVFVNLIVQVVRQGAVIQMLEMGQYFHSDGKKATAFQTISAGPSPLRRWTLFHEPGDKLAPDAEEQEVIRYWYGAVPKCPLPRAPPHERGWGRFIANVFNSLAEFSGTMVYSQALEKFCCFTLIYDHHQALLPLLGQLF
ncbi:hypothetical protein TNCV_484561 [Trichonephila clavipes]|nr:hypothetical protein TNCV_484561 [Trichonephila clavipes]